MKFKNRKEWCHSVQHFQSISLIGKKTIKNTKIGWRLKGLKKKKRKCGRILHHIMEKMNNFIHASAHQVLRISNLKEKDTAKVVKTSKKREIWKTLSNVTMDQLEKSYKKEAGVPRVVWQFFFLLYQDTHTHTQNFTSIVLRPLTATSWCHQHVSGASRLKIWCCSGNRRLRPNRFLRCSIMKSIVPILPTSDGW